ncbi:MAG TPA: glycoside hydrolase family 6 protein, partial [Solirubrobacteraceae bacterium]|nr:glycoside hydrolase family 6 protein [Solirubrobacteraceae bacterium]
LQPLMYWFGAWNPDPNAATAVSQYIRAQDGGNPNVLSQMAVFRLDPWEGAACKQLPTEAEVASYKSWVTEWAQGIGSSRVAMDLQPDLPFEDCIPDRSQIPAQEVNYAAQVFGALPHTTVYIDAGSADWDPVSEVVSFLRASGVQYTRGFALNATHYDSVLSELIFGQKIVRALAADGIPGMHFVINTATNGRPFSFQQVGAKVWDESPVCATKTSTKCVTLGVPPTTNVTADAKQLGLNPYWQGVAKRLCDAYLWIGRPWLNEQAAPFELQRAIQLGATTPF